MIIYLIFDNQEIQTTMTHKELKQLLILCTKNVCFTFSGKTFVQFESVTMELPLRAVLPDIFMVELENTLVPTLTEYIKLWKGYADDAICFLKTKSVEYKVSILNSFDVNI